MVTKAEFDEAVERSNKRHREEPHIVKATYDAGAHLIVLVLSNNTCLSFSPDDAQMLEHASPAQLSEIEVLPSGYGIHLPQIDADFSLPGLLAGRFGTRRWMADRQASGEAMPHGTLVEAAPEASAAAGERPRRFAVAS